VTGLVALRGSAAERFTKGENRLHVAHLRHHEALEGLDHVVKAKNRAVVRLVGAKSLRIGAVGVDDRKDVRHRPRAVLRKLLKAANREKRNRDRLHGTGVSTGADGLET
jgi:hypothetical protein